MEMSTNILFEGNVLVVLFLGILMFAGFLGNSVVCYVYIFKMKTSIINLFIIALAVFDLINCCVNVPLESAALVYRFAFTSDYWLCVVLRSSVFIMATTSNFLLLAIAVERYKKICRPLKNQISKRTANVVITVCFFLAFLAFLGTLPAYILYGARERPLGQSNFSLHGEPACTISDKYVGTLLYKIHRTYQVLLFVALTVSLFVLYFLIWRRVLKQDEAKKCLADNKRSPYKLDGTVLQMTSTTPSQSSDTGQAEIQQLPDHNDETDVIMHFDTAGPIGPREATGPKCQAISRVTAGRKMTCMLFVITLVFILSFMPCIGVAALVVVNKHYLKYATLVEYVTYHILSRSFFIQSVSNPIIYTIYNKQFRHHAKRLVTWRARENQ